MFTTLLNIFTMLLIGFVMKMIIPAILYTFAYIPIRVYAGGYHASTPKRCWVFSAVMLFVVLGLLKCVILRYSHHLIVLSLISCVVIIILSPVADMNKPLNETEYQIYRLRAIVILIIEMLVARFMWIINFRIEVMVLELVWCSLAFMLVLGKLKNRNKEDVDE